MEEAAIFYLKLNGKYLLTLELTEKENSNVYASDQSDC